MMTDGSKSADHPNAQLMRRIYEAWGRKDATPLLEVAAEDMVWHIGGNHRISGEHEGIEAVAKLCEVVLGNDDGEFCPTFSTVIADDDYALVVTGSSGMHEGEVLSWRVFDVIRFEAGRIKDFWTLGYPQRNSDLVWS